MSEEKAEIKVQTAQTLDTMLHQILNLALVAIEAEAGSLMLVDNKRGILQIKARLGKPRPGRKTEPVYKVGEKGIAGWVVQNKEPYLCPDVEADKVFTPPFSGSKNFLSVLSVPVVYEEKVLAVLNADAAKKGYFVKEHQKRLEIIAQRVAAPIAERISILDALAEVGVELSLLPSEGGVEPVLKKIATLAVRSLGADVVTLYQYIQDKDEFPVEGKGPTIAGDMIDRNPMRRKVFRGDVPWTVVKKRKPGFYPDAYEVDFLTNEVERPGDTPRQRFIEREGIKSMAALLLPFRAAEVEDEEVVGVMFVNYRTHHEFNMDETLAFAIFANYAAIAIRNARDFQKLQEARELAAIGMSAAAMAHRMRTPLQRIMTSAENLSENVPKKGRISNKNHKSIDRIINAVEQMSDAIERVRKAVRHLKPILNIYDIREIIKRISTDESSLVQHLFKKQVHFQIIGLEKIKNYTIQCDINLLEEALSNLIQNSFEAVSKGGHIEIKVLKTNSDFIIEVKDNGPGVNKSKVTHLFEPFNTTKKAGLGLGLFIVRRNIEAHGGIVSYIEQNKGACFQIELPQYRIKEE